MNTFYFFDFDPHRKPFDKLVLSRCWVQWHGSHCYGVLAAVGQNFISRSEAHKFDPDMPRQMTVQQKKTLPENHQ